MPSLRDPGALFSSTRQMYHSSSKAGHQTTERKSKDESKHSHSPMRRCNIFQPISDSGRQSAGGMDARSPTNLIHAPGHTFSLTCFVQQSMPIQCKGRPTRSPLRRQPVPQSVLGQSGLDMLTER